MYTLTGGILGTAPTGEPFVIMDYSVISGGQINLAIGAIDGSTTLTISISKSDGSKIHKIDPKYLGEIQENNSHKQLVTDRDGNTVWEDKLAYEDPDTVIEFLPETILAIDSSSTDTLNFITKPFTAPLVAGETYNVNWNGTNYECVAIETSGAIRVGKYDDSTEPFLIDYVLEPEEITGSDATIMLYGVVAAYDGSKIVNVSITQKKSGTIKTVDPKYLPEGIGYETEGTITEILPQTTLSLEPDPDTITTINATTAGITQPFTLTIGELYSVNWNNTIYECVAEEDNDGGIPVVALWFENNNVNIMATPEPFNGEDAEGNVVTYYGILWDRNGSSSATISITQEEKGTIHKIDPKYIDIDINSIVTQVAAALGLPVPTAADAGKILRVNAEGKYELVSLPNAEEATF